MSHSKQIITHIENRKEFMDLLQVNPGCIVLKFGATWCGPCKKIAPQVEDGFMNMPENVICGDIDVDESFDVFAFLKNKKMTSGGIPVILCYKKGNITYVPDDSVLGADPREIDAFFKRVYQMSLSVSD